MCYDHGSTTVEIQELMLQQTWGRQVSVSRCVLGVLVLWRGRDQYGLVFVSVDGTTSGAGWAGRIGTWAAAVSLPSGGWLNECALHRQDCDHKALVKSPLGNPRVVVPCCLSGRRPLVASQYGRDTLDR